MKTLTTIFIKINIGLVLILGLLLPVQLSAQEQIKPDSLFEMSLAELMKLDVTIATLVGTTLQDVPASVTTITAEDIKYTPAKNINDLIEIYVPGAMWTFHCEGLHTGIRGIIADRDYKYILLVNGRNMNQKAHSGVRSEMENWDMNDIEKIEVIRGPGAVTYGPGAVAGIINITTKNAITEQGTKAGVKYLSAYNSVGADLSHSFKKKNYNLYLYGSIVRTQGYTSPNVFITNSNNESGYMGRDFTYPSDYANPPLDFLSDYKDEPQIKLFTEFNFKKDWTFWARYTTMGGRVDVSEPQDQPQIGFDINDEPLFGKFEQISQLRDRHFTLALENTHKFSYDLTLKSLISWDSEDHERGVARFRTYEISTPVEIQKAMADINSARNKSSNFAEDELLIRILAEKELSEKYKAVLGIEYSLNHWGPGWGDNKMKFRMGDSWNIISGIDSYLYDYKKYRGVDSAEACFVGNGWTTHTYSIMGEVKLGFDPLFTLLLSARLDKDSYSKYLFSPRIAIVSKLNEKNILKLIGQRSQRMNTAEQLLIQHRAGNKSDPETLTGFELIYNRMQSDKLFFSISSFYNQLEVLSWDKSELSTTLTGDLSLYGIELEAKYISDKVKAGINHSFVKQLKWKLAEGVGRSGISFADFNVPVHATVNGYDVEVVLSGVGNDLNNWSNHATKFFSRFKLCDKIILHTDAHVFWGFKGANDGLKVLENAAAGTDNEEDVLKAIESLRNKDALGIDFRFNMSLTYKIKDKSSVTVYAMNLIGTGSNKRYMYDTGLFRLAPYAPIFIEEPRAFGFKLNINF
ncbi:MAG: TonB-dependent receptor plug domain-containing protein [Bacteroidales bacterium]|nr:TonB-dependent receptor plug domain-containing protein [Bacteroidales bacterium]